MGVAFLDVFGVDWLEFAADFVAVITVFHFPPRVVDVYEAVLQGFF